MDELNRTNQTRNEANETAIQSAIAEATGQAYRNWALAHPSLAGVIDRAVLTERTAQSLRNSPEYKQAIAGFHESKNEMNLLNQLMNLAGPALQMVLGI